MIKIEISGGSAEEISTHISELANLMSGTSVPAIAAATAEAPAAEAPKPTRRSRKTEAAVEKTPEPEVKTEEPSTEPEADPAPAEATVEDVAADEPPVDDTPAEEPASPNLALFQGFDTAGARTWIIENYLNPCFADQAERTAKFREIVSKFGYNSLTAVPAEKLVDVLLFTEEKIKEHAK